MSSFSSHVHDRDLHPALVMYTPVAMGEALHPAIRSSTELEASKSTSTTASVLIQQ